MIRLLTHCIAVTLIILGLSIVLTQPASFAQANNAFQSRPPQAVGRTVTQTLISQYKVEIQSQLQPTIDYDAELQVLVDQHGLTPLSPMSPASEAKIELGRLLFFDKILSGNRDTSCATCHHPTEGSGDGIAVSVGTGGSGVGSARQLGDYRNFVPRNAPEIFNRGAPQWTVFFWDGRLSQRLDGGFNNPADNALPANLDNILAVQAMFPVTSRDEMRGAMHDQDLYGQINELSYIDNSNFSGIWETLGRRLLAIPEYVQLFQAAYPNTPTQDFNYVHAANAIAAFEGEFFTTDNSPWNRYLSGDKSALSVAAKAGAGLFYSKAGCVTCHNGPLLTDQRHHNIAVPQVGPGKGEEAPLDFGRARETQIMADKFAFRTPSLHNVAMTPPYMHNGAFNDLESAVRHHLNPATSLRKYDPAVHLRPDLQATFQNDERLFRELLDGLDPLLPQTNQLTDTEIAELMAFLNALTDPNVYELNSLMPESVPSGLPVD